MKTFKENRKRKVWRKTRIKMKREPKKGTSCLWIKLSLFFLSFSLFLHTSSPSARVFNSRKLFLIRKSKSLPELQKKLSELSEEKELKRACQIEEEQNKIPKACFHYSSSISLSKEEKLEIQTKANELCKNIVQKTKNILKLKRWHKITSLSSNCKKWLKEKETLLIYKKKDSNFLNPSNFSHF